MKKILLSCTLLLGANVFAQTFTFTTWTPAGALSNPVAIVQAPGDDRLYIVEQSGTIRIVNTDGTMVPGDWFDISRRVYDAGSEQGLLGLAFDPDYQTNGYFYVNYTIDTASSSVDGDTRISRFSRSTIDPNFADTLSEVKIMCVAQPYTNHNGGGLAFGPDGYLYSGMGDGGSGGDPGNRAQNPNEILGKMLRINVDAPTYTSPVSNPFYGMPGYKSEIWAVGVRNPWRFNFDRLSGDLWIGDVGQDAYEEIDHTMYGDGDVGLNYGWKCYEGTHLYPGGVGCGPVGNYTMPVAEIPQLTGPMCSITMGEVYRGAMWGDIYNKMIFTDYCNDYFWTLTYDTATSVYDTTRHNQMSGTQFLVSIVQDNRGFLYASNLSNDRIYRIGLTTCTPAAIIEGPSVVCSGDSIRLTSAPGVGLTYQWTYNSVNIPAVLGGNDSTIMTNLPGDYQLTVTNPTCGVTPSATSAILTVTSGTTPSVTLNSTTNDSICVTGGNLTLVGSPAGGDYVSPYVNGAGTFYTAVAGLGDHDVVYSFTDASGCTGEAILPVNVNSGPAVNFDFAIDSVCSGSGSVTLSGGFPSGGTYSGTGVSGTTFDPSALPAGNYNIIYTYTDGVGCTNSDTSVMLVSGCLGIEDLSFNDILLFPNPADEMVNLTISSNINTQFNMDIVMVDGKLVEQRNIQVTNGQNQFVINTSSYASGVYFVQLNDGIHHITKKIVIR